MRKESQNDTHTHTPLRDLQNGVANLIPLDYAGNAAERKRVVSRYLDTVGTP